MHGDFLAHRPRYTERRGNKRGNPRERRRAKREREREYEELLCCQVVHDSCSTVPLTELHLSRFNCAELLTGSRRYGHCSLAVVAPRALLFRCSNLMPISALKRRYIRCLCLFLFFFFSLKRARGHISAFFRDGESTLEFSGQMNRFHSDRRIER